MTAFLRFGSFPLLASTIYTVSKSKLISGFSLLCQAPTYFLGTGSSDFAPIQLPPQPKPKFGQSDLP
ncbi:hypothetical protein AKJ51_04235 [candidate division MSBL1 archaeon SCGC-AAA382A20]|uniref:Uncharacterized protein n=1 Tax=candidate division MSBL1 archaeon SCGC-AAA382A20 TaxID=1698280 RepID=A0A133VI19_9EURY|nr:hypothetical protein AKJ51_04235 [candidate division MSBL1 archaeon SCGC-AAA382A20]